jgi:hypothetical protein
LARLSSHHRNADRPPRDLVLKHVVTSPDPAQHWEWDTTAPERRFNRHGHAIWSVKTTEWRPRQIYVVARLLLDDFHGPFPPRASFESRCGLASCVNPGHWRQVLMLPPVRLQPQHDGWIPVVARTGKAVNKNTPLIVHAGDATTHVLIAGPNVAKSYRTVCGLEVYPTNIVVHPRDALVTCKGGCT